MIIIQVTCGARCVPMCVLYRGLSPGAFRVCVGSHLINEEMFCTVARGGPSGQRERESGRIWQLGPLPGGMLVLAAAPLGLARAGGGGGPAHDTALTPATGGAGPSRSAGARSSHQQRLLELEFFDSAGCSAPALSSDAAQRQRLLCYVIAMPNSTEIELLRFQMERGVGIFSCDNYAVFSNSSDIGLGFPVVHAIDGPMSVARAPEERKPVNGDALNTPLFMPIWRWFASSTTHEQYDWAIKLDADSVFYAPLMRQVVADRLPASYPRCRRANRTDPLILTIRRGWLPGPIEAFNAAAMERITSRLDLCSVEFPPSLYGEDIWLQRCREQLDEARNPVASCVPLGERLVQWTNVSMTGDADCALRHGLSAALHPYKTVEQQRACYDELLDAVPRLLPGSDIASATRAAVDLDALRTRAISVRHAPSTAPKAEAAPTSERSNSGAAPATPATLSSREAEAAREEAEAAREEAEAEAELQKARAELAAAEAEAASLGTTATGPSRS